MRESILSVPDATLLQTPRNFRSNVKYEQTVAVLFSLRTYLTDKTVRLPVARAPCPHGHTAPGPTSAGANGHSLLGTRATRGKFENKYKNNQ